MDCFVAFLTLLLFRITLVSAAAATDAEEQAFMSPHFIEALGTASGLAVAFGLDKTDGKPLPATPKFLPFLFQPFRFPIYDTYGMDLSRNIRNMVDVPPRNTFGVLIRMVYRLVEFHVKRMFKLDSFTISPSIHNTGADVEDPQNWFYMLLNAIIPGADISVFFGGGERIRKIFARPFQPIFHLENILTSSDLAANGTWRDNKILWRNKTPYVPVHVSTTYSPGQQPPPDHPLVIGIMVEKEYPHYSKILQYLVKDVTVAFDMSRRDLDIVITPTKDLPPAAKSRGELLGLLKTPFHVPIMLARDALCAFGGGLLPKAACYHPKEIFTDSPEHYERMMTVMVADFLQVTHLRGEGNSIRQVADSLENTARLFLPNATVKAFRVLTEMSTPEVCTYTPKAASMHIYKGKLNDKPIALILKFGEPVHLSHIQMAAIRNLVFPYSIQFLPQVNRKTIAEGLLHAVHEKLKTHEKGLTTKGAAPPPTTPSMSVDLLPVMDYFARIALMRPTITTGTQKVIKWKFEPNGLTRFPHQLQGKFFLKRMLVDTSVANFPIMFQAYCPMPPGSVFAVGIAANALIRNSTPMMLLDVKIDGPMITYCVIHFVDKSAFTSVQNIPDAFYATPF